jgi:GAF domain-containing protein
MTGHVAASGRSLLVANALECELAAQIPGSEPVEESAIAVPLRYEERVTGVIFLSKLGVGQLDESDLRLLEVLAGYVAVALENARLYEAARREA